MAWCGTGERGEQGVHQVVGSRKGPESRNEKTKHNAGRQKARGNERDEHVQRNKAQTGAKQRGEQNQHRHPGSSNQSERAGDRAQIINDLIDEQGPINQSINAIAMIKAPTRPTTQTTHKDTVHNGWDAVYGDMKTGAEGKRRETARDACVCVFVCFGGPFSYDRGFSFFPL